MLFIKRKEGNKLSFKLTTLKLKNSQHKPRSKALVFYFSLNGYISFINKHINIHTPFGSQMPGRIYNGANYRYGFNGKENDNEVKGTGNQQDYGMRIYDNRLGRFLSSDPLSRNYPWNSTFAYAENDVIRSIDLDGGEKNIQIQEVGKNGALTIVATIPWSSLKPGAEYGPAGNGSFIIKVNPQNKQYEGNYVGTLGDIFRLILNYISGNDNPNSKEQFTQRGGLNLYAPSMGGVGTEAKAKYWRDVLSINIDELVAYLSTGLKTPLKGNIGDGLNGTGTQAGAIGDIGGIIQEVKEIKAENKKKVEPDSITMKIKKFNGDDSLEYKAKRGEEDKSLFDESKRSSNKKSQQKVRISQPMIN
jgi:RHS repeat-associated protein